MFDVLLSTGADINIHCTGKVDTPLHTASCIDLQDRQYEMQLEKVEAMFHTINKLCTVRQAVRTTCIPRHDELAEIIMILLQCNADPKARNFDGDTLLHGAIQFRNSPAAFLLR
jgi:hypothetical protein